MNDSILTTLVLSLTLLAVLSVLFDLIMYARSERVGHTARPPSPLHAALPEH